LQWKEEWKEERDIETLLVPKEECEVEDIEFTWPVYLVEYLSTQGFSSHLGQNISHLKLLNGEYYTILPSTKLTILQFLCDDIMEAEEVRTEINMRVNFEQDTDMSF